MATLPQDHSVQKGGYKSRVHWEALRETGQSRTGCLPLEARSRRSIGHKFLGSDPQKLSKMGPCNVLQVLEVLRDLDNLMATLPQGPYRPGRAIYEVRAHWEPLERRGRVVPGVYLLRQDRGAL